MLLVLLPRLSRNLQHSAEFTGTFFPEKGFLLLSTFYLSMRTQYFTVKYLTLL